MRTHATCATRIRKILVPAIKKINPAFTSVLMRLTDILREDDAALQQIAEQAYCACGRTEDKAVRIRCELFNAYPKAVRRRIIRTAIGENFILKDIEYRHVDDICKLAEADETGKSADIKNRLVARVEYGELVIEKKKGAIRRNGIVPLSISQGAIFMPGGMQFECRVAGVREVDIKRKAPNEEYFDLNKFPRDAVIRFRTEGDMFHPLNFLGRKKLKNYLSDKKNTPGEAGFHPARGRWQKHPLGDGLRHLRRCQDRRDDGQGTEDCI